ncbi:hypothetical protein E1B28_006278 [Marasmius oreades]|uniref:Uncharacterized protein n=1 Tax=Marasmius oreades TaxID=181124 RepID=A0A9P7UVM7_9AGAR|nr:uncharacterized protein E1B28_006278 [Marasmius oreades]KAG7095540.1 hypothetical protein E1B28_006278 [Marasmius oreades]
MPFSKETDSSHPTIIREAEKSLAPQADDKAVTTPAANENPEHSAVQNNERNGDVPVRHSEFVPTSVESSEASEGGKEAWMTICGWSELTFNPLESSTKCSQTDSWILQFCTVG